MFGARVLGVLRLRRTPNMGRESGRCEGDPLSAAMVSGVELVRTASTIFSVEEGDVSDVADRHLAVAFAEQPRIDQPAARRHFDTNRHRER